MVKKIASIEVEISRLQEKLALANTEEMAARLEGANALRKWHTQVVNSHGEIDAKEGKVQLLSAQSSDIKTRITALEKELDEARKEEEEAKSGVVK